MKNMSVVGVFRGAYRMREPAIITRSLHRLFTWFEEGTLHPVISGTLPLERAAEALRRLLRREARGKIVLTTTA